MPINQSVYFFGNSLVNYAGGGAGTNIPVWMDRFAEFQGNGLTVEGGYGFLRNFADTQEPNTDWGFPGVAEVYDAETTSFAEVRFDNVVITPGNFIQDRAPDESYFDEDRSPLDAVIDIVSGLSESQPDARVFVYQGWADMAPFAPEGLPTPDALAAYHDYNSGEYQDWFFSLIEQTAAAVPDTEITLIPVAAVLSEILSSRPLSEIPVEDLYVDSAPHGTETIYFLAGLTTYAAIYGTVPPADFGVPDVVHPAVAINFIEVTDAIAASLQGYGFEVATPLPGLGSVEEEFFEGGEGEGASSDTAPQETVVPPVAEEPAASGPPEDAVPTEPAPEEDTYHPGEALSIIPQEESADEEPVLVAEEEPEETIAENANTELAEHSCISRQIEVGADGAYRFELKSDDLAILHINGKQVMTNPGDDPGASQNVVVELSAGTHLAEVFYFEENGGEILILDMGPEGALAETEALPLPATDFDEIPEEEAEEDLAFF